MLTESSVFFFQWTKFIRLWPIITHCGALLADQQLPKLRKRERSLWTVFRSFLVNNVSCRCDTVVVVVCDTVDSARSDGGRKPVSLARCGNSARHNQAATTRPAPWLHLNTVAVRAALTLYIYRHLVRWVRFFSRKFALFLVFFFGISPRRARLCSVRTWICVGG